MRQLLTSVMVTVLTASTASAAEVLVEAEAFQTLGG
jgi:hypothetical protein